MRKINKTSKIQVIIRGGMGNQMFQFAYAKSLSLKYGLKLEFIDLSSKARVKRNWGLSCFGIEPTFHNSYSRSKLILKIWLVRKIKKVFPQKLFNILVEDTEYLGPPFLKSPPLLISGYWQGESYFFDYTNQIKSIFSFSLPSQPISRSHLLPSVAIHVRRGDFASDPIAKSIHLVCTPQWYRSAWNVMKQKIGDCRAIVFSDDPEWTKLELKLSGNVIYNDTDFSAPAWVDMASMSQCDHFIISNSSYSWWAAWLGKNPNKIVIAPKEWLVGKSTSTLGLCPPSWILF